MKSPPWVDTRSATPLRSRYSCVTTVTGGRSKTTASRPVERLHRVDRVRARTAPEVEELLAPGEIDQSAEPAPGAHADAVGGGVIAAGLLDREVVVHPEFAWRGRIGQTLGHREPLRHLGPGEVHPGTGVPIGPLDQELLAVGGVHDATRRPAVGVGIVEESHRQRHGDQPLGVQFAHSRSRPQWPESSRRRRRRG